MKNTGTESLKNVVIGDALATDCYTSAIDTNGRYEGSTFDPGDEFEVLCEKTGVQENTFPNDENIATVSAMGFKPSAYSICIARS